MWMKKKFIIPALIVLVVIALLVYFFWKPEKYTSEVVLTCTFTTPITYGYQSSFSSVVAYIIDCGTDVTTCVQPKTVTDDQLSKQLFIKLTDLTTIEIDDTNKANLLLPSTSVTLKIHNTGTKTYTIGNTYAVGIAIKNKDNLIGDFIYGTAKLDSSDVPVTYVSYGKKTACRGSNPDGQYNPADFTTDSPLLNLKLGECKDKCTKTDKCKGVSFVSTDPAGIDSPGQCFIFTGGEFAPYGLAGAENEECWYASTATKGPPLNLQKNPSPIKDLTVAFHSTVTPGPPAPPPGPPVFNPFGVIQNDKSTGYKLLQKDFVGNTDQTAFKFNSDSDFTFTPTTTVYTLNTFYKIKSTNVYQVQGTFSLENPVTVTSEGAVFSQDPKNKKTLDLNKQNSAITTIFNVYPTTGLTFNLYFTAVFTGKIISITIKDLTIIDLGSAY